MSLLWGVLLTAAFAGLLHWSAETAQAVRDSLSLCAEVILPALFPFFVLSSLVVSSGLAATLGRPLEKQMHRLFRVNGACASALVLGLIGGYPVGAKTTAELYRSGQCTRAEAERLLFFCNNAGPAFLIGVVGSGIFRSRTIGLLLEGIHILSALMIGFSLRFLPLPNHQKHLSVSGKSAPAEAPARLLPRAIQGSVSAMLNICGFIVLFAAAVTLLDCCGLLSAAAKGFGILLAPLGLDRSECEILLRGMLELTNGAAALDAETLTHSVPMAAFLLGWGGGSVHCQTMSVLEGSGLSARPCLIGKLTQGLLSAALAALGLRIFPASITAAVLLPAAQIPQALPRIGLGVGLFGCGLVLLTLLGGKSQNRAGNQTGNRL